MKLPFIVIVDDDVQVLRAIQRDMRNEYRDEYRVVATETAMEALELIKELKLKNVKLSLQRKLPSPDTYIDRPFIEMPEETGGISIHLSKRLLKRMAIFATLAAGLATLLTLLDYLSRILKNRRFKNKFS